MNENKTKLTVIDGETLRNIKRHTDVFYSARDESAVSDGSTLGGKSCVPSVPCAPVSEREPISARLDDETEKLLDRRMNRRISPVKTKVSHNIHSLLAAYR